MEFEAHITVETTHTIDNKQEERLVIAKGILTWVSILFPTGCNNLVHCTIAHHEHQIAPSTEGMTIIGNKTPVQWIEHYECYEPPHELRIKCWGVGCNYPHLVTVRVAILPRRAVLASAIVDALAKASPVGLLRRVFTKSPEEE